MDAGGQPTTGGEGSNGGASEPPTGGSDSGDMDAAVAADAGLPGDAGLGDAGLGDAGM